MFVLVAAAGNDGIDLNHPTVDEISPDFPPGAAVTRPVNNSLRGAPDRVARRRRRYRDRGAEPARVVLDLRERHRRHCAGRLPVPDPDVRSESRDGCCRRTPSTASDLAAEAALGRLVQDANGNYYAWLNGTSMAAPHVAGVVALIRAAHPGMPQGAVVALLRSTATAQPCPAALDPGVVFFEAPVQVCTRRQGQQQLLRQGAGERAGGKPVEQGQRGRHQGDVR